MRMQLILSLCLMTAIGMTQTEPGVVPRIMKAPVEDGTVTMLHLAPGYTTSVELPEEVSSVAIGNPATFKAEHAEAEPRLVFFKPITTEPSESNALITTKTGHEISLHLVSSGRILVNAPVDFLVEYQKRQGVLIDSARQNFLIADTHPITPVIAAAPPARSDRRDLLAKQLNKQKSLPSPDWHGKELRVAVGESSENDGGTIVAFSVLNSSKQVIELLPPQLQLTGTRHGKTRKINAEPIVISEYRMTTRRLQPGQRCDGVIMFQRPAFKESAEQLQLRLARPDQVDRAILLPVPFTPGSKGDEQ